MKDIVTINNGPGLAAILAAGLGSLALGFTTTLAEAIPSVKTAFTFSNAVGPLSGKTIVALIIWIICWAILHNRWKNAQLKLSKVFAVTLILIGLGLVGTFPLFYDKFH